MPKSPKKMYACGKCGAQFLGWQGGCTECGAWGTIVESVLEREEKRKVQGAKTIAFSEIPSGGIARFRTGIEEVDRVLGGGLVVPSTLLLGGNPGIGKSTLVLAIAASLSRSCSVLYVSGEEALEQVKHRMERLHLEVGDLTFLAETDIEIVCATLEEEKPNIAIVDSIQTMKLGDPSEGGDSMKQLKMTAAKLTEISRKAGIAVIAIGHVTKTGEVAGPKMLEHLVDNVLFLEGDRYQSFRILRSIKNRFGNTNEIGVFEMTVRGLEEVRNPSEVFLKGRSRDVPGMAVTAVVEGSRPFLVEVQALVSRTSFGYPQRRSSGFDTKRLELLIAVLTKRASIFLLNRDVHINIVGGVRIKEPAVDLAVALAIVSAVQNTPLPSDTVCFGEVGLGGEVRAVRDIPKRLEEAYKLGFQQAILPNTEIRHSHLTLHSAANLRDAIRLALSRSFR